MKLLALDTAMAACSVAVHDSGKVLAKRFAAMERGHAEAIAPMVRDVMSEAGLEFAVLDRAVVTVGPGTFTGVRIGLAMARGLGLALGIPVVGVDTLSAILANAAQMERPRLVAADARKDEVYAALFDAAGKALQPPSVLSIEACLQLLPQSPVQVLGTAADTIIAASTRSDLIRCRAGDLPDAANFGRLGSGLRDNGTVPVPLYLRAPDAKPLKSAAITIRPAGRDEAEIFARLHGECFESAWGRDEFAKFLAMPGAAAALAISGSEPVGFILARRVADETEIITIGTIPASRRLGIAKALIDHQCTETTQCFIEVAVSNAAGRALYAAHGFNEAGVRRGYYERSGEDAIIMRKDRAL